MSIPSEIFKLKRTKEWIAQSKTKPVPKMLFGEFWLEGELSILFADTGKGKSILAVQIAESIALGRPIEPMNLTAKPQTVLYFDFELSEKQFEMRYAPDADDGQEYLEGHYEFSDNFYRAEIDVDGEPPDDFETFEEYLRVGIENNIRSIDAKVVIVDNITWLRGASDTARRSLLLMRELKRLKKEFGLSILVLAHTPKRDLARRISVNDLQGSKILSNFADNVFAIGQSNVDAAFRYVKHIKPRSTELVYDTSNVLVGEIRKWEKNFLGFRFTHFGDETAHLSRSISGIRKERVEVVAAMSGRGMSQREIARELGISASSVNRYLQISRDEDDYDFDDGFYPEEDKAEEAPAETNLEGGPWWQLEKDPVLRHKAYMMRYKLGPYAEEGAAHEKPNAVYDDEYEEDDNGDDDDDDPMARYGLTSEDDAHDSQLMTHDSSDGVVLSHNSQLTTHNSSDKIEIGDIVLTRSGQLKRKTLWGWDASVEGVESG